MKKRKISNTPNTFGGRTICLNSKGGRNGVVGLQPSLKDRIYDSRGIACAIATAPFFMPNYLIKPKRDRNEDC